jgi:hypothetical protein
VINRRTVDGAEDAIRHVCRARNLKEVSTWSVGGIHRKLSVANGAKVRDVWEV